jgi:hypothetical protein
MLTKIIVPNELWLTGRVEPSRAIQVGVTIVCPLVPHEKKQDALGRFLQEMVAQLAWLSDITALDSVGQSYELDTSLSSS